LEWASGNSLNVRNVNTSLFAERRDNKYIWTAIESEVRRSLTIIWQVKKMISRYRFDIAHLNTSCGKYGLYRDYLCAKIISNKGIKLIVHYHCNIGDQVRSNWLHQNAFKRLADIAIINLILNETSRDYINQRPFRGVILLPNFIEHNYLNESQLIINSSIQKIIYVGHVSKAKGVEDMISVANSLPAIKFTLVGPIYFNIKKYNIPTNMTLTGPKTMERVRDMLMNSDIFLFPTYSEGFSMALLEAMAAGLPVIATNVGANPDMLEKKGGIIVNRESPNEIVIAINKLNKINYRSGMSRWNILKVKNNYVSDIVLSKLASIYENTISHV